MTTDKFPFSRFSEKVCQLEVDQFDTLQSLLFDYSYYLFSVPSKYRRYAGDVMHTVKGFGEFKDYNLPRRRYFAICNDRQMENIQMCYEMKAYTKVKEIGPLMLGDASREHFLHKFNVTPRDHSLFTLLDYRQANRFINGLGTLPQLKEAHEDRSASEIRQLGSAVGRELGRALGRSAHEIKKLNWRGFLIYFPLTKRKLTASSCIDLRYRETRRWFFDRYRRGIRGWPGYGYDAAEVAIAQGEKQYSGFLQMLPALCNHEPGGRLISQVIGADLRRNGVECLVYPSARCNFFAEFNDGELVDSYGWNLVDYRGAGKPRSPTEEGFAYVFVGDIVVKSDGSFSEDSERNKRKMRDLDEQVEHIREVTGRESRGILQDPHNPWIPKVSPWLEMYDLFDKDPLTWWSRATEKYSETGGWAWPLEEYQMIEIDDGPQRGSIAIEGVQEAFDQREAELVSAWVRENSTSSDGSTE
ncbi:hypothetical protein ACFL5Q_02820 [Planctomycetota bacterium]